ncbi:MAG: hypothetical protein IPL46_35535 [Saprospiraceae bacterium]|nr:hypothetical protein [Saprospiraceae bacterium]
MNFKNQIQKKYRKEVDPIFNESNWQSFLTHRKKKKRKPFLILWSGIGIAVFSTMIWYGIQGGLLNNQTNNLQSVTSTTSSQSVKNQQTTANSENPSRKTNNTQVAANEKEHLVSPNHIGNRGVSPKIATTSVSANSLSDLQLQSTMSQDKSDQIEPAAKNDEPSKMEQPIALLESRHILLLSIPEYVHEERLPFSIHVSKNHWIKSIYTAQLYGGLSHPFNVQTAEEKAFQFGGKTIPAYWQESTLKNGDRAGKYQLCK